MEPASGEWRESESQMATTLVNIDVTASERIAKMLGSLSADGEAFSNECKKYLVDGKVSNVEKLVELFLSRHNEIVESDMNTSEYVSPISDNVFQGIVSVVLDNTNSNVELMSKLIDNVVTSIAIKTDNTNANKIRLNVMLQVYNMVYHNNIKFKAFIAILKYSIDTKQTFYTSQYYSYAAEWCVSWNLSVTEKRQLYFLFAQVLTTENSLTVALQARINYLKTFTCDAYDSDAQKIAIETIIQAINSSLCNFTDRNAILECITPKQLTVVGDINVLLELLRIICLDNVASYEKFAASNKEIMNKYSINPDDIFVSMKLLTLCSLAAKEQTLSYQAVATALNVSIDEVESWIVESISQGLLEVSMDQFKQIISVNKCVYRSFGINDWKGLQIKLSQLRANLLNIMEQ